MEPLTLRCDAPPRQLTLPFQSSLQRRPGVWTTVVRSALVRSRVPGVDFAINPYLGCRHRCAYCYAPFNGHNKKTPWKQWGQRVGIKENLPGVLERELSRGNRRDKAIFLSSITDPYQPIEGEARLTRDALELLVGSGHRGTVMVMTKSPLVVREAQLLGHLNHDVGVSLTPADDPISQALETGAPPVEARLDALAKLNRMGLRTFVFVGPIFNHLVEYLDLVTRLLDRIRQAGTSEVYLAWFNARVAVKQHIARGLPPALGLPFEAFHQRKNHPARRRLERHLRRELDRLGLRSRTSTIIDH